MLRWVAVALYNRLKESQKEAEYRYLSTLGIHFSQSGILLYQPFQHFCLISV